MEKAASNSTTKKHYLGISKVCSKLFHLSKEGNWCKKDFFLEVKKPDMYTEEN